MDDMAVEVEDSFASEAAALTDMMEIAPDVLGNDTEVAVLSPENSVEDRITSLQDFSDYYETMLDQYEQLAAEYDLGDDLKDAFEKLLNQETWDKIKSVLVCLHYMRTASRGFDMYVTSDGVNFETLTTSGFGDPYNHGLRVFAVTNQGLVPRHGKPVLWHAAVDPAAKPRPSRSRRPLPPPSSYYDRDRYRGRDHRTPWLRPPVYPADFG